MSAIKRFRKLSHSEWVFFIEALFWQVSAGMILKIIPFRRIPRVFASRQVPVGSLQSSVGSLQSAVSSQQSENIELITSAIRRAEKFSLWRNRCLVSSLAARRMLNRRRIHSQVSLGLAKNIDGRVIAHAWIRAGEVEIVEKRGDYVEIYQF